MRSPARVTALLLLAAAAPLAAAPAASAKRAKLPAFKSCSSLVTFGQRAAVRPPIHGWLPAVWQTEASIDPRRPQADPGPEPDFGGAVPMPAMAAAGGAESKDSAASESSSTNVQEAGVDEPDVVKVVGTKLFLIAGSELLSVETAGGAPQIIGRLALPARGGALLLLGDKLLTIGPATNQERWDVGNDVSVARPAQVTTPPVPASPPRTDASTDTPEAPRNPESLLQEIDVSDPRSLKVLRSMKVPGTVSSARMSDGVARLVVNSIATLPAVPDSEDGLATSQAKRLGRSAFVPRTLVASKVTGKSYRRDLVACRQVRHPSSPAGTNLVTVLSVDMQRGLINVDRDGVLVAAQTTYASTSALYVGASRSAAVDPGAAVPEKPVTELHRFAYTEDRGTAYAGGGTVRGVLLNQYSLSEYQGKLRVATSDAPQWWSRPDDENQLTVLEPDGSSLRQIGFTGGLGKNERIYAARLIGDRGYLVTFRRTDPLYVLDLSDPAAPKTTGELKIPGYSAYLHPIGDDLLLGVGQDGTGTGRVTGAQLSLFDVKDPAKPTRIAQTKPLPDQTYGSFLAEEDPHAFLWWPQSGQAMVPMSTSYLGWGKSAAPLISVKPSRAGGLQETGRLEHGPEWDHAPIERVAIAGGKVVAISDLGVSAATIGDLAPQGFTPLVG